MADDTARKRGLWDRIRECLTWSNILDLAYVTWVLRAPVVVLAVGLLVLGLAPQRNRKHQVIDRIVDGGYIENFGALTAMEIAQAIRAIEPELAPFVLAVSNDPDSDPDINPLDAPESAFLSDIVIPIQAIASARTGHGRLAMGQVDAVLDHLAVEKCGAQTAHVRVWPQFAVTNSDRKVSRPVSMSWWLSTPIQIHLHQQTALRKNQNQNDEDLGKIWSAVDKPADCVGRPLAPSAAEIQLKQQELRK
jgi:hypothetical protein